MFVFLCLRRVSKSLVHFMCCLVVLFVWVVGGVRGIMCAHVGGLH